MRQTRQADIRKLLPKFDPKDKQKGDDVQHNSTKNSHSGKR